MELNQMLQTLNRLMTKANENLTDYMTVRKREALSAQLNALNNCAGNRAVEAAIEATVTAIKALPQ